MSKKYENKNETFICNFAEFKQKKKDHKEKVAAASDSAWSS